MNPATFPPRPARCNLVQWARIAVDGKVRPVCPKCLKRAKVVLGIHGVPVWTHSGERGTVKNPDPDMTVRL